MPDDVKAPSDSFAVGRRTPGDYIKESTLPRIKHFLADPGLSVYSDLKGMCERVSDSYRDRVVIELLQNAHDAHSSDAMDGRIKFILDPAEGRTGHCMRPMTAAASRGRISTRYAAPRAQRRTSTRGSETRVLAFLAFSKCPRTRKSTRRATTRQMCSTGFAFSSPTTRRSRDFLSRKVLANLPRWSLRIYHASILVARQATHRRWSPSLRSRDMRPSSDCPARATTLAWRIGPTRAAHRRKPAVPALPDARS